MGGDARLRTIIGMSFLFAGGFTAVSPVLPDVMMTFGISATAAGLMLTVFAGGRMAFSLLGGMIADRVAVGVVIGAACILAIVGSTIAIVTTDYTVLLVGRALQGIGTAFYMVAGTGYIIDVAPPGKLPSLLAWNQSMMLSGMSLGPALGGLAASVWGYRGPFVLFLGYGVAGLVSTFAFLRRGHATPDDVPNDAKNPGADAGAGESAGARGQAGSSTGDKDRPSTRTQVWKLLATPVFLVVLGVSLIASTIRAGVRSTVVPLYAADLLAFDASELGFLLTAAGIANLVIMYPVAKSVELLGWHRVMAITTPLSALPLIAFVWVDSALWMYVLIMVLTMISGFSGVVSGNAIADLAPSRIRKTAVGIDRTVRDFAFMASPVALTYLVEQFGFSRMFQFTGGAVLGLGLLVVYSWLRPSGPPRTAN